MKAITYSSYGPPDVLRLEDVARPVPKDDEVLIRVRAAEATKSDCEPVDLTTENLTKRIDLPLAWTQQSTLLGFD